MSTSVLTKKINIQDEIAVLETEIAAANARIAKANAEAEGSKRKAEEYSNSASKVEAEVLKFIFAPNFPETERQRILVKMRVSKNLQLYHAKFCKILFGIKVLL